MSVVFIVHVELLGTITSFNWCALYRVCLNYKGGSYTIAAVGGKRCPTPSAPPSSTYPIIIVHCLISSADARDFFSHKLVRMELPASSEEDGFSLQGILHR